MSAKKGAMEAEELGKAVIAIGILLLVLAAIFIFSGKTGAAVNYIKNLFRFG